MNSHETNRLARELVESELLQRGVASVHTEGKKRIRMHVTGKNKDRTVILQVKSKRKGNWHSNINEGKKIDTPPTTENQFWIFIALERKLKFWIVPDWWIRNHIYTNHQQYLAHNGGHRPVNDDSDHCSIGVAGLYEWENRWDILEIF